MAEENKSDAVVLRSGTGTLESQQISVSPTLTQMDLLSPRVVLLDESKQYPYFKPENDNNKYSDPNELGKRPAWLSTETTIEEINVNDHYFRVEGYLNVFWKDMKFDPNNSLQKYPPYTPIPHSLLQNLLSEYAITINNRLSPS